MHGNKKKGFASCDAQTKTPASGEGAGGCYGVPRLRSGIKRPVSIALSGTPAQVILK
jgi:hypothetical protein